MKTAELRELNQDELLQKLQALKNELFDLRRERAAGKLTKPHRFQQARRDVARILTVLHKEKKP